MDIRIRPFLLPTLALAFSQVVAAGTDYTGEQRGAAKRTLQADVWRGRKSEALERIGRDPTDAQAFEDLGRAELELGHAGAAQRAILSILEIAPRDPAMLARAGFLLLAVQAPARAADLFQRALNERADDPNLHRGLALAHWMNGRHALAAEALEAALGRDFNSRYGDIRRVFREELGYIYRSWIDVTPSGRSKVKDSATRRDVNLARTDALRVTACWNTDANDVDLHVTDPRGEECNYQHRETRSGLKLYSDQTQGLGPEVIRTEKTLSGRYRVGVKYYNAGAMGKASGVVVVLRSVGGEVKKPTVYPFTLEPNRNQVAQVVDIDF